MRDLVHDVRYAFRQLRHSPGFTVTALLTLAVGIGANAAIFTLVHGVLLQSLPIAHPEEIYKLGDRYTCCVRTGLQDNWAMFSYPFYETARDHTPEFVSLAAAQTNRPRLSVRRAGSGAPAESLTGEFVSGNYFTTLGVQAVAGRTIAPDDDRAGAPGVAVLSDRAWEQHFGRDRSILGASMTMNGVPVTIVGVTPPAFFGDRLESDPPGVWLALNQEPAFARENTLLRFTATAWLYVFGRLRTGVEPSQVSAQLTTELRQFYLTPGNASAHMDLTKIDKQQVRVVPGGGGINAMKDEYERGLLLLMAVSAALLLIACANLANLLLARGAATRVRTALQLAIGASRARIVRGRLTESLMLALAGGAAGLVLARVASQGMLLIAFRGASSVPLDTSPSPSVLLFTFAVALATGVVFGVGPAWMASHADPAEALRGASRSTRDASARSQKALVVLQAAMSLALLTVAGLLTRSLDNLERQAYGFERDGRLVVEVSPQAAGYTQERLGGLYDRIEERLGRIPGVVNASLALYTAQQGNNWGENIYISGRTIAEGSSWDRVGANYFEAMGTPILRGRGIGTGDTAAARKVAVVNEAFARRFFPGEDPIGQHFGKQAADHAGDYEIVGIAADAKYQDATDAPEPMFFVPRTQKVAYSAPGDRRVEDGSMYLGTIVLHAIGDPNLVAPEVRRALADVDPNLTPMSIRSFGEQVRIQTSEHILIARLTDAFGLIALLLASVGLYGVTAYRVARRTSEVGLRMALGASRRDIVALVMRGAFTQVGLGLLLGIPLALLARQWLQHQLFGISGFDPWSLSLAIAVLGGCAFVASIVPALRAAGVEPTRALRAE